MRHTLNGLLDKSQSWALAMISRPAPKPGRVKAASRPQGLPLRRPGWRGPLLGLNNAMRSEPPLLRAY